MSTTDEFRLTQSWPDRWEEWTTTIACDRRWFRRYRVRLYDNVSPGNPLRIEMTPSSRRWTHRGAERLAKRLLRRRAVKRRDILR